MFYRVKKIKKKTLGGGGVSGWVRVVVRPRVKNPNSPNGTETSQLTIYKRGRGFTRVIHILIRYFQKNFKNAL